MITETPAVIYIGKKETDAPRSIRVTDKAPHVTDVSIKSIVER